MKEKRGKVKSYWSGFFRAMIVALLVLTQFVAIFMLSFWLAGYTVYIYLLMEMASILIMLGLVKYFYEKPYLYRAILAVTFTNKATEEMKSRILK